MQAIQRPPDFSTHGGAVLPGSLKPADGAKRSWAGTYFEGRIQNVEFAWNLRVSGLCDFALNKLFPPPFSVIQFNIKENNDAHILHFGSFTGSWLLCPGFICRRCFRASVAISSPPDGAKISPKGDVNVDYEVSLGKKGDHTHLYLDSNEAVTLRGLKGTHALGTLSPGQHEICIKVVNKAHTPIGAQKCINVSIQPTT